MNISPRIFNVILVALVLGMLYWISIQSNTAQDAPNETPAVQEEQNLNLPTGQLESLDDANDSFPAGEGTEDAPFPNEDGFPHEDLPAEFPFGESHDDSATSEELAAPNYRGLITISVFVVLVLGCYWLGTSIAKRSRLPDHGFKLFIVFLAFFGGFAALALGWERLTLGIDLQGGVVLTYEASPIEGNEAQGIDMDELTRAIGRRVNPGGVREIAITHQGTTGHVQIVIPHAEQAEVARIERVISESGALTFRILASRAYTQDELIIERGLDAFRHNRLDIQDAGRLTARWVPIFAGEEDSFRRNSDMVIEQRGDSLYALVKFDDGVDITGEYLTNVGRGMGRDARPGVSFQFNSIGSNKCGRLTTANRPDPANPRMQRHMGIILNESLYSAPTINEPIHGNGIITFGEHAHTDEARQRLNQNIDDLIGILHAGALPAKLEGPVSRMLIGATLGYDTVQKAQYSLAAAAFITIAFMLCYYRLAGCIAAFCVITNTVLIVAIMLSLRAAFTLPGLAGLVLTIGMAIDANILIYERIREELKGGASLKMAIRNGYAKAFSAIFDSNITTIVIGCILYAIGTEQVKGFAVTLVLGIALNLFTAIFCARVIMDVLATQRWLTTFKMMQLFERPNINFLKTRVVCAAFSITLILIGLMAVFSRGRELLDIDFVGGVSVEAVFKQSQEIAQVRARLNAMDATIDGSENRLNDLSVQNVQIDVDEDGNPLPAELRNTRFIITTSTPQVGDLDPNTYLQTVRNILRDTFLDELEYQSLNYEIIPSEHGDADLITVHISIFPRIDSESLESEIRERFGRAADSGLVERYFSPSDIVRMEPVVSEANRARQQEGSQESFEAWTVTFRAPMEDIELVFGAWNAELDGMPNFPTSTTIGGSVARHTRLQGLMAIIAGLVFMAIYISVRFTRWQYGLIAVIGLIHVVLVVLGLLALSKWLVDWAPPIASLLLVDEFKIGLPVVAAFLAVIAYAINDTIILFDRIRENLGKSTTLYGSMINAAINQVLARTVLTSATTFFVAMVLYTFGGQGIHAFSFAIAVGIACGTYSTIFICAPLLFWLIGVDDLGSGEQMELEKMD
ncbi:MAG: protein translocase subunit SecD [Planctomycetaceae bacterium]|nr:protein translocase subunit SecD [Planctomycetaceae bacterium]